MPEQVFIIQASSRSWSGDRDLCMNIIEGRPVIYWTIKRILDTVPNCNMKIVAPDFDRNGELGLLPALLQSDNLSVFYGHDASPLNRMIDVCKDFSENDYVIRIDGLHFCVDLDASMEMLDYARENLLDCVKLPDDFPVQFTSDIYRVGALRKMAPLADSAEDRIYHIHPKYYMFKCRDSFRCAYANQIPVYTDEYLLQCRKFAENVYQEPRQEINEKRIWSGDQLTFHYEIALEYLEPHMKVLDIGCGYGGGVRMLAEKVTAVYGADIDANVIDVARQQSINQNVSFYVDDVTDMSFPDAQFDAVTSMETIEHVNPHMYMREVCRVLKPGGLLILSTPQNRIGHIPIHPDHVHEYSLEEITDLCGKYFTVHKVIGIKAGRIVLPNDSYGHNTVLISRKQR